MLRTLGQGVDVCITITIVDGLVLARSAFHHSINYRSVVVFGNAKLVDDREEKNAALLALSEHFVKGRWGDVRGPNEQELRATTVLSLQLEEASAKIRTGPPLDDEDDYELPVWAGVIPLSMVAGEPIAGPLRLPSDIPAPHFTLQNIDACKRKRPPTSCRWFFSFNLRAVRAANIRVSMIIRLKLNDHRHESRWSQDSWWLIA
jgi:hypothetical protein